MDSYLAEVKRKYAGQNASYDPDAFKDAASLKIADDIMTLLPSLPDGWVVVPLEPTREMLEVCGWSGVDPGKPHPMIAHTTVAERGKPYLLPKAYYRAMLAARPTPPTDGWLDIVDAPLNVEGHLWSPTYPDRVDATGTVYAYADGERGIATGWSGVEFTKWHPFPPLPRVAP